MNADEFYMGRAIELARHGLGYTSPNPMVGCVIVADKRIIGQGWHRCCGEGHAEVNAVASVDAGCRHLLRGAMVYVTLEPCSHYGKTPPCARLLVDSGVGRVVIGSMDPFEKVSGRGVAMLLEAGIEVCTGVLEKECRAINPVFMLAHEHMRPWITLKWAQSSDGFIDKVRGCGGKAALFSTELTSMLVHRLRSLHDAILVGSRTLVADSPRLDVRLWHGRNPRRYVADRTGVNGLPEGFEVLGRDGCGTVAEYVAGLYGSGITSVLVEGGAALLQSFVDAGLYDMVRVETAPFSLGCGVKAPVFDAAPSASTVVDGRRIDYYGKLPWYVRTEV